MGRIVQIVTGVLIALLAATPAIAETYRFSGTVNLTNMRVAIDAARVKCRIYSGSVSNTSIGEGISSVEPVNERSRTFSYQVDISHNGTPVGSWRCHLEIRDNDNNWTLPTNESANTAHQYELENTVRTRQGEF